jgi:signal transduction histidine kinase
VDIVRACVEEHQTLAPARAIQLDVSAAHPLRVVADADRIGQVVTNYLTNALRYAPEDRPIAVSLHTAAGHVRVAVRDEGPGISPAQQRTIWARFERAARAQQPRGAYVGLGLGLYISREIIEHHGGQVGVDSTVGQGSTFWFMLPLAQPGT